MNPFSSNTCEAVRENCPGRLAPAPAPAAVAAIRQAGENLHLPPAGVE